jgi:VanZ family protein
LPVSTTEPQPVTRAWFPAAAWKQWIPALIWIAIITVESTDLLSSEHTGSVLYAALTHVFGTIDPSAFEVFHHFSRKAGHFVGFFILSYLLFRAWRATLPTRGSDLWSLPWARISFLMSVMVATLDEWHQSTIPSRTGTFHDVILDSTAALVAQAVLWWLLRAKTVRAHSQSFSQPQ